MQHSTEEVSYRQLVAFFVPLGVSASLTAITHVIINSTLSRGENAAFIIACYAVAFAVFSILERPIIVFRQTSSVLAVDKSSFKTVNIIFIYTLLLSVLAGVFIGISQFGDWIFIQFFNATEDMVETISRTFLVITLVFIFSGIRGMYQGVIINHLQTKWLTIGVVIRLAFMFLASYLFVLFDFITSMTGALIFLIGMLIECVISVWKGHRLLQEKKQEKQSDISVPSVLRFYIPLVFYFVFQTLMVPIVYAFIAKTDEVEISIASFALALSIAQLVLSFFMYTHQLVIQFYKNDRVLLVRFMVMISLIPALSLAVLCFSSAGEWFMAVIMGADEELASTTLAVLAFFILKTLLFPWVDFLNGFLMLHRQTKQMIISQTANLIMVIISLFFLTEFVPHLNGINGAIAASLGEAAGLLTVIAVLIRLRKKEGKPAWEKVKKTSDQS